MRRMALDRNAEGQKPILAIGAANAERILRVASLTPDAKAVVAPTKEGAGGSAVNHTCRLLAAGVSTRPLVPMGRDHPGKLVRDAIRKAAKTGAMAAEQRRDLTNWMTRLTQPGCTTGYSTIIVEDNGRRTSFSETATSSEHFAQLCEDILETVTAEDVSGVVIGHIHSDAASTDAAPTAQLRARPGAITSGMVSRFAGRVPVVANLGRSQYMQGPSRWLRDMRRVDLVQMTFDEAVEFLAIDRVACPSLREVATWFRANRIAAVITVDQSGAIGIAKDDERVVLARPYELGPDLVDSTGAGDAMAAGLVAFLSALESTAALDAESLRSGLDQATAWAACACRTLGGATDCPSRSDLLAFTGRYGKHPHAEVVSFDDDRAARFWAINKRPPVADSYHRDLY